MQADGINKTIYVPSANNLANHSRFFYFSIKNQLSYGEN